MNEQIKKLAEKTIGANPKYAVAMIIASPELEQFAELLIRECVTFCEHESNGDEHDDFDSGMWCKARSIKTSIMEHFGIK